MTTQVEVELGGVSDPHIHRCAGGDVTALSDQILLVGTEEASVVPLLNDDEGDTGLISYLQLHACLSDSPQLMREDLVVAELH